MKTLVGYIRVSSLNNRDKDSEAFKSPEVQKDAMVAWAKARYGKKHKWVGWFEDLDRTGANVDRPKLKEAVAAAKKQRADIVVFDFSRYSRNVPEGLAALQSLEKEGIKVRSATENIEGDSAEDELTLSLFLMLSQYQLRKASDGWRRVVSANKSKGAWHGVVPFGYRRATTQEKKELRREVGVIVPDKKTAPHVRKMFSMYAGGASLYKVGLLGVQSGWFRRIGTAREILRNPAYIGFLPVKEYEPAVSQRTGLPLRDSKGRHRKTPKRGVPIEMVDGRHKAIIKRQTWDKVQERLKKESRAPATRYTKPRWSAAGRTRCDGCSRALTYTDKTKTAGPDARYLVCKNRDCLSRPGSVKVVELEKAIDAFMETLNVSIKPEIDSALAELNQQRSEERQAHQRAQRLLTGLYEERDRLHRLYVAVSKPKGMDEDSISATLVRLSQEIAIAEAQVSDVEPETLASDDLRKLRNSLVDLSAFWKKANTTRRVEVLEALGFDFMVSKARVRNDNLDGRLTLRTPFDIGPLRVVPLGTNSKKAKSRKSQSASRR